MRTVLGSIVMVAVAVTALLGQAAQSADPVTVFDVASVKSVGADDDSFSIDFFPGGRFVTGGLTLRMLIGLAYNLRQDFRIVGGPGWITSSRFEIQATSAGNPSRAQSLTMLRTLLADRFKLRTHREQRDLPTYQLVMAGSVRNPRLRPTDVDCAALGPNPPSVPPASKMWCGLRGTGPNRLSGQGATIFDLVSVLASFPQVNRPVFDATSLAGRYDFVFDWSAEKTEGVSFFTLLDEQLGLKLEPTRGPVDMLVIDSAEPPSQN